MVVKGNFRVSLVEAKSKQPFREHTRSGDGEVFVEVEPDAEYFIEVEVKDGEAGKNYNFRCYLDGERLQGVNLTKDYGPYRIGYPVRDSNGNWTSTPIRFVKSKPLESENPQSTLRADLLMGNVIVQVSETIDASIGYRGEKFQAPDKPYACDDLNSPTEAPTQKQSIPVTTTQSRCKPINPTLHGTTPKEKRTCPKLSDNQKQKVLRSAPASEPSPAPKRRKESRHRSPLYVRGSPLQEIKVNYCTTLGLIHAEILPKPPVWDVHKLRWPRKPTSEPAGDLPPVETIRVEAVMAGNVQISAARDVEIFDLA